MMNITKETISVTCPHCGHSFSPHAAIHELAEGLKLTCEKCGGEIAIDGKVLENMEQILQRLGVGEAPPGTKAQTRSSITHRCPHCGHSFSPHAAIHELAEGLKLTCEKCGGEIAIDGKVLENMEQILQRLGVGEAPPGTKAQTRSSITHRCPHCGATSSVAMSLSELGERDKIFCTKCGKEIPIDREKIQKAQNVLAGLTEAPGDDQDETFDTPVGTIIVKRKTLNVDMKTDIGLDETAGPDAGIPTADAPTPAAPHSIEPRKGCLGVVAIIDLLTAAGLIYGLFG